MLVVGGGLVGLATAWQLSCAEPGLTIRLVDKEDGPAVHQSGRNSGVLHSGIYYAPGSLKAENCRAGKRAMEAFCAEHGIDFEVCGKVIVATDASELESLARIEERGHANGVQCERIGPERLRELEPHVAGIAALHVPEAGICDYPAVARKLVELLEAAGHVVEFGCRVVGPSDSSGARGGEARADADEVVLETDRGPRRARCFVNCGGLYSDRIARRSGVDPGARIVPFRGEYWKLRDDRRHLCRNLIYPVPDPAFPFLGVHFTRMVDGAVECGPNAVLALRREGYTRFACHPGELFESLTWPGFLRLAARHWRAGAAEVWRSLSKSAFTRSLQRLVPEVRAADLEPAPAGVRAQALRRDGAMVDDFLIVDDARGVHVCNAPSPAATASLNIGKLVAGRVATRLAAPA